MGTIIEVVTLCFFGFGAVAATVTALLHSPEKQKISKPEQE